MTVQTKSSFAAEPEVLWPLLFGSKMDRKQPCFLLCGLPKPLECRLPDSRGGVGSTRECVSDKGVISQRITEWIPGEKLSFELVKTDIYFGPCMESIVESFHIRRFGPEQSEITRKTTFRVKRPFGIIAAVPMYIGLKAIHRYVFSNWKRLSAGTIDS